MWQGKGVHNKARPNHAGGRRAAFQGEEKCGSPERRVRDDAPYHRRDASVDEAAPVV